MKRKLAILGRHFIFVSNLITLMNYSKNNIFTVTNADKNNFHPFSMHAYAL